MSIKNQDYAFVRNKLLKKEEIALLDVREEDPHAREHPLFAANLPLSRIEIDAYAKLPKKNIPIVTLDDGASLTEHPLVELVELVFERSRLCLRRSVNPLHRIRPLRQSQHLAASPLRVLLNAMIQQAFSMEHE